MGIHDLWLFLLVGVLLNITPDHLDRHGTLENYARIKSRVFAKLPPDGTAVIGVDEHVWRGAAPTAEGYRALVEAVGKDVRELAYRVLLQTAREADSKA